MTARYSFLGHLAQHPALPMGVGWLTVVMALLFSWLILSVQIQAGLQDQNRAMLKRIQDITQQLDTVFDQLAPTQGQSCSPELLAQMRRLLYDNDTVGDIEFMPSGEALAVCSATLGAYDQPRAYPPPQLSPARRGREIWPSLPPQFDPSARAYVVKEGRFAISVNVRTTGRGLDLDRIEVYSGNETQFARHLAGEEGLFSRARVLAASPYGLNLTAFACSDPAVSVACVVSAASLKSALSHQGTTIVLAVLLSVMVGLAASRAVRHIQLNRASPRGRIVRGVKKKSGFFCLYQPIVEMDSGQIIGCEVLARFEDSIGPLYPDAFIPMIEKANLTWPFTQQIIGQALASLGPLCKARPDFKVSVNFYPKDLQERHLGRISDDKALRAAARDGTPLNCEILETGIGEAEDLTPVIAFLHQQGFTVAIDDFGTGYSNLSQLSLIDAEYLKIDKSFVQGLNRQEASVRSSLVPHILEIAKIVKIDVIAEGIETEEHLDVLRGMGVRYGQGFLFSRPVPLENLVDLVQRGMRLGQPISAERVA